MTVVRSPRRPASSAVRKSFQSVRSMRKITEIRSETLLPAGLPTFRSGMLRQASRAANEKFVSAELESIAVRLPSRIETIHLLAWGRIRIPRSPVNFPHLIRTLSPFLCSDTRYRVRHRSKYLQ